jgi:hypothetical protein
MVPGGFTYDEGVAILTALRRHERDKLAHVMSGALFNRRIVLFEEGGHAYLKLRFEPSIPPVDRAKAQSALGDSFSIAGSTAGNQQTTFRIEYDEGPQATPLFFRRLVERLTGDCSGVKDGHSAGVPNASHSGTVGWCFVLNDTPVGLSNWHVFSANGISCTVGDPVLMRGQAASLWRFVEPVESQPNVADFALARFKKEEWICGMLRDDAPFDVPLCLTQNLEIGTDAKFRMTGNASISSVDKKLETVTDVDYSVGGKRYRFNNQLVFEAGMAQSGDSGAVAVRENDNSVTGLLFAAEPQGGVAYANPICRLLKWTHVKDRKTTFGRFPVFQGAPLPSL